jgi:hypothetical protein
MSTIKSNRVTVSHPGFNRAYASLGFQRGAYYFAFSST